LRVITYTCTRTQTADSISQANLLSYIFNICVSFALHVESMRAILANEIVFDKGRQHLWLESDSQFITFDFKHLYSLDYL
jgi:hypothetical protein